MRGVVAGALLLLSQAAAHPEDPVPALLVRLESRAPVERAIAARELGRLEDGRALDAVRRAQEDEAEDVRHEAALALAKAGKADATTVAILSRSLEQGDWYVRWQACVALKRVGKVAESTLPALVKALGDETIEVSREAAHALAAVAPEDPRTVAALVEAVGGKGDRAAIFEAIGTCGPAAADAIPLLVREVKDSESRFREKAFAALQRVAPRSVPLYAAFLDSEDPTVREFGARGLGGTRSKEALPELERALRDREPRVRVAAARAAQGLGRLARKALPALVPLLVDPDERVHEAAREAAEAMGARGLVRSIDVARFEGEPAVPIFWISSDAEAWDELLADLGDAEVGPAILEQLSRIDFRSEFIQASLEDALRKGWSSARRCALLLLPRIATDRASAAAALQRAREDPDLKDLAERALEELRARK